MTDDKQEGQKTVVSFIVGLLIGGLLVWAFSGPAVDAPSNKDGDKDAKEMVDGDKEEAGENSEESEEATAGAMESNGKGGDTPVQTLPVGDGKVSVADQAAGNFIELSSATYPISEGWIGVRDYEGERLGGLLGVARFSEEQGLVPNGVPLQRSTEAGKNYAIVVYSESGDRLFSLANDIQIDSIFATFTAK
jgi:hypothetical protein